MLHVPEPPGPWLAVLVRGTSGASDPGSLDLYGVVAIMQPDARALVAKLDLRLLGLLGLRIRRGHHVSCSRGVHGGPAQPLACAIGPHATCPGCRRGPAPCSCTRTQACPSNGGAAIGKLPPGSMGVLHVRGPPWPWMAVLVYSTAQWASEPGAVVLVGARPPVPLHAAPRAAPTLDLRVLAMLEHRVCRGPPPVYHQRLPAEPAFCGICNRAAAPRGWLQPRRPSLPPLPRGAWRGHVHRAIVRRRAWRDRARRAIVRRQAMALFQVGPDRNGYKYTPTDMEANGKRVYRCQRGTDSIPGEEVRAVLYLYMSQDGHWVALEAARTRWMWCTSRGASSGSGGTRRARSGRAS